MPWCLFAHGSVEYGIDLDPRNVLAAMIWQLAKAGWNAAPSLLVGLVLAGILDGMVGAAAIRRLFGAGRWTGPLRAWAIGLLVPTCSLGVLPIARAIHRAGVPPGTVLSFLLVAPVFNPFSLVFGLSLLGPATLGWIVAASLLICVVGGGLCNLGVATDPTMTGPAPAVPATGLRRLAAAGRVAADDLVGPMARDLALAALGVGLLGALLPSGWLQVATCPARPSGPLLLAAVATPAYVGPLEAMRQAGSIVRDGYPGTIAFALLVFGGGLNLAVVDRVGRLVGRRIFWPALGFLALYPAAEYAVDALGFRASPDGAFHTHALDDYGRSPATDGFGGSIANKLAELPGVKGPAAWLAIGSLAALASIGMALRRPSVRDRVSRWIEAPRERGGSSIGELVIPKGWLIAIATLATIGASIGLVLTHYPPPEELFEEMDRVRADVYYTLAHGPRDDALREIRRWEDLAQKLEPGVLLHRHRLDPTVRVGAADLHDSLRMLRELVEEGRGSEARTSLAYVSEAYQRCRRVIAGR